MSDASMAGIAKARRIEHLEVYFRSGGVEGHVVAVSDIGGQAKNDIAAEICRLQDRQYDQRVSIKVTSEVVSLPPRVAPTIVQSGSVK